MSRHAAAALLDQLTREAQEMAERSLRREPDAGDPLETLLAEIVSARAAPQPPAWSSQRLTALEAQDAKLAALLQELEEMLPASAASRVDAAPSAEALTKGARGF